MKNGDQPAFANPGSDQGPGSSGLTKRELIAAMAMKGLLSNSYYAKIYDEGPSDRKTVEQAVASQAIAQADELLKQLETK